MQSPLKTIIVYDLETGGLLKEYNTITEIAMVAVDLETLSIKDEMSVMIKPRIDLRNSLLFTEKVPLGDTFKDEAKELYKRLGEKDLDTGIKTLPYGKEKITLKNLVPLIDGIKLFHEKISSEYRSGILTLDDINTFQNGDLKDIFEIYYSNAYNEQALDITKISKKMLVENGVEFEDAFKKCEKFIKANTSGNHKPILAGHNIKGFDNPFFSKFFLDNKSNLEKLTNKLVLDTLELARLKFWELSSYSLGVVSNEVGLTLKEAHRALPDTVANAHFLIKLLKSLRGDGGKGTKYVRRKFKLNY